MFDGQMTDKIVGDQIRIAARQRRTNGTHHLQTDVRVLGADMLEQRCIAEAHFLAVRTGETLRLIGRVRFARIVQLKVGPSQNALHRMIGRMTGAGGAVLIAAGAQIVIVTVQTFVTAATKITFETRITADTYRARRRV